MTSGTEFDSIRPYNSNEIEAAIDRLCQSQEFLALFSRLTQKDNESIITILKGIKSRDEFQLQFFGLAIQTLIGSTTDGVSVGGMELVDKDDAYIFISNHRDIILDSAILNMLLIKNNNKYTRAAIGSNLLLNEWVTDLVKLISCFVIERNVSVREMLTSSTIRSKYICKVIEENKNSIWIAQREGRTKNGDDRTQGSLLKMLKMHGSSDFIENFKNLHILPLSISYEWEPCDVLKVQELYVRETGEYTKTSADDMNSMLTGLSAYKGRVHFQIDQLTELEIAAAGALPSNGQKIEALAALIDSKIYKNFKLWPNNYIAYDLLNSVNKFTEFYTPQEKENFTKVMTEKINKLDGNISMLNHLFLDIYANPVKNSLNL